MDKAILKQKVLQELEKQEAEFCTALLINDYSIRNLTAAQIAKPGNNEIMRVLGAKQAEKSQLEEALKGVRKVIEEVSNGTATIQ